MIHGTLFRILLMCGKTELHIFSIPFLSFNQLTLSFSRYLVGLCWEQHRHMHAVTHMQAYTHIHAYKYNKYIFKHVHTYTSCYSVMSFVSFPACMSNAEWLSYSFCVIHLQHSWLNVEWRQGYWHSVLMTLDSLISNRSSGFSFN